MRYMQDIVPTKKILIVWNELLDINFITAYNERLSCRTFWRKEIDRPFYSLHCHYWSIMGTIFHTRIDTVVTSSAPKPKKSKFIFKRKTFALVIWDAFVPWFLNSLKLVRSIQLRNNAPSYNAKQRLKSEK